MAGNGDAAHDTLAVPVLVHVPPSHFVLPDALAVTVSFVEMTPLSAAMQSVTLLLLLSMKFPSQKIAPVVVSHSSVHVVVVSLSHCGYNASWHMT